MFTVYAIDEAKRLIRENFTSFTPHIETVSILNSVNRFLAIDIYANAAVPHFNRSTVDGYAIKTSDVKGACDTLPSSLFIVGEVIMGQPYNKPLSTGEAIYVPTGGVLPQGADAVVMIEDTEVLNKNELFVYKKLAPKENVLFIGEDIKEDTIVLNKGHQIKAQDLGLLTAIGYTDVKVFKKIRFTVISTGDEIIHPNKAPRIGEIRDINTYTISGIIEERNHALVDIHVIKDNEYLLKEVMEKSIEKSDVVVISGGSSVGERDLTTKILNEIETDSVFVHGIAMKPGKPTVFAKVKDKLVFGLPGQPASAFMVFQTFISHIESVLLGKEKSLLFYIEATLAKNVHSTPGRETYQMVKVIEKKEGYLAEPIYGKSGTMSLITEADGFIIIPVQKEGIQRNEKVKVYKL